MLEAYLQTGIRLIVLDSKSLPLIPLAALKQAYSQLGQRLEDVNARTELGLHGEGPWPVVLAGYVINALGRQTWTTSAKARTDRFLATSSFLPGEQRKRQRRIVLKDRRESLHPGTWPILGLETRCPRSLG